MSPGNEKSVDECKGDALDKLNRIISFNATFATKRHDLLVFLTYLTTELKHVIEARTLGNVDGRCEVIGVCVLIRNVFDEQHQQDVILVLTGVHAAARFIAACPK